MARYKEVRPASAAEPCSSGWKLPEPEEASLPMKANDAEAPAPAEIYPRIKGGGYYLRNAVPDEAKLTTSATPAPHSMPEKPKFIKVALIGAPNAGKSSLMNCMINRSLAAVSPKVNTTREEIRGVVTDGDHQIVVIDAPGVIPADQTKGCRALARDAWTGYNDCDLVLLVVDTLRRPDTDLVELIRRVAPKPDLSTEYHQRRNPDLKPTSAQEGDAEETDKRPPVVLCLNKIDKSQRLWVQKRADQLKEHGAFKQIFFISAKKDRGVKALLHFLKTRCKDRDWAFPPDVSTTLPMVEQVEQLVRTYLFCWFNKDLPYKIEQQTVGWTPRLDGGLTIEHELKVQDSIVLRMICGTRNRIIRRLRQNVAYKLEQAWGIKPIQLVIWVKAKVVRRSKRDIQEYRAQFFEARATAKGNPNATVSH
ncbi:Era Like 12S Mitochondrial RRNA Chaperone 1 [Perkinsus chesapeaki]|uniref:Era Like 12S Mitochondrial RRNA Chaperone 1 n=1 Tax=Perkinsus chesapeaki TaxID=330153 RepID=A0A7J6MJ36_PERCH|nr:Era Like 12S Mitochondrial RRNA Chaperone 1 [Perkinsus chesapeaki]